MSRSKDDNIKQLAIMQIRDLYQSDESIQETLEIINGYSSDNYEELIDLAMDNLSLDSEIEDTKKEFLDGIKSIEDNIIKEKSRIIPQAKLQETYQNGKTYALIAEIPLILLSILNGLDFLSIAIMSGSFLYGITTSGKICMSILGSEKRKSKIELKINDLKQDAGEYQEIVKLLRKASLKNNIVTKAILERIKELIPQIKDSEVKIETHTQSTVYNVRITKDNIKVRRRIKNDR